MKDLRPHWNVVAFLLVFGALLGSPAAQAAQSPRPAPTALQASSSTIQFGSVALGGSGVVSDYIFNPTSASVTINSATASNDDFQLSRPALPVTIGSRQWVHLVITFSPHAAGSSTGTVVLSSTAKSPTLTLSLSGIGASPAPAGGGTPGQIAPSPSSLSFGTVAMGSSSSQPVSLTNSGSTTLLISQAASSASDFTVSGLRLPVLLASNHSVSFSVIFFPKATGTRTGSIALAGSSALAAGSAGRRGTPQTTLIPVTGLGSSQSSGSGTPPPVPGSLAAASLSFGTVPVGSSMQKTATITNSGSSNVTVNSTTVSGTGFTMSAMGMPMTLAPNQSMNVSITCAPKTAGTTSGSLTVNSNATDATLSVPLSATATAVAVGTLTIAPASFNFGSVQINSTQSLPGTMTNSGGASVTVTAATFTGASYSVSGLSLPLTLAAGQSAPFNVVFAPTTPGTDNFSLAVTSNASNPSLTAAVTGSVGTPGALSASATSLAFGSVTVGSNKSLQEKLTNTGGSSITLSQTAAGGGYTVSGLTLPLTLAAGASTSFSVLFTPTSAISSSVSLAITTSNPVSSLTIPLSGSGITSGVLSVSPVSFGSVQVGQTGSQTATVKNTGGSSLTVSSATLTGPEFGMNGLNMPLTLSAGQSFTFGVNFSPTTAGPTSGTIALVSDAASSPSIALSGTATPAGQLSVSPGGFSFGSVTLNTSKALPVTLSATGASVTVTAASVSNGTEFSLSGPSLPLTIPAGGTASFSLMFDPQASGAATASMSFTSSASSSPVIETATGSGAAPAQVQHSVELSWAASSSAVNGYNVYRGSVSGGPYSKIDPSTDTTTSYTDSTVQAGQTYYYVTTAVGTDGMESSFSNQVTATIPTP